MFSVLSCFVLNGEIHSSKGPLFLGSVWEDFIFACSAAGLEITAVGFMPSQAFSYVFLQFEPEGSLELAVGYFLFRLRIHRAVASIWI